MSFALRTFSALGFQCFRIAFTCWLLIVGVPALTAQAQSSADTATQEKPIDTEPLLYVLRQAGWLHPAKQGVEVSGTLERFFGEQSDSTPIRISAYGERRLRIDLSESRGPASFVLREDAARSTLGDKPARKFSPQAAKAAHEWMMPWLFLERTLAGSKAISIKSATIQGLDAIGYKFVPAVPTNATTEQKASQRLSPSAEITVWVSIKGLPIQIDYLLPAEDNHYAGVPCSRTFLEFQTIDGVLVPKVEDVYLDKQRISRLRLESVALSEAVNESTFVLPAVQGGAR